MNAIYKRKNPHKLYRDNTAHGHAVPEPHEIYAPNDMLATLAAVLVEANFPPTRFFLRRAVDPMVFFCLNQVTVFF